MQSLQYRPENGAPEGASTQPTKKWFLGVKKTLRESACALRVLGLQIPATDCAAARLG